MIDINSTDALGYTLLIICAAAHNEFAWNILDTHSKHLDVDARTIGGETALMKLCENGDSKMILRFIIKFKPMVSVKNESGLTAFECLP